MLISQESQYFDERFYWPKIVKLKRSYRHLTTEIKGTDELSFVPFSWHPFHLCQEIINRDLNFNLHKQYFIVAFVSMSKKLHVKCFSSIYD